MGRLPSHRGTAMRRWLNTQRHWLAVGRLPADAPELNPVEGLWSCLKAVELVNLASPTLVQVIDRAHQGSSASAAPVPGVCVPAARPPVGGMIGRPPQGPRADRALQGRLLIGMLLGFHGVADCEAGMGLGWQRGGVL